MELHFVCRECSFESEIQNKHKPKRQKLYVVIR